MFLHIPDRHSTIIRSNGLDKTEPYLYLPQSNPTPCSSPRLATPSEPSAFPSQSVAGSQSKISCSSISFNTFRPRLTQVY